MSRNGNLCVLKDIVKGQYPIMPNGNWKSFCLADVARKSVEYWNKAYDKWLPRALAEKWDGGEAIIMPDSEKMTVEIEPSRILPMLKYNMFMTRVFGTKIAWRNVALVRNKNGDISKVCMIDLEP
jgi:hypothetical protein